MTITLLTITGCGSKKDNDGVKELGSKQNISLLGKWIDKEGKVLKLQEDNECYIERVQELYPSDLKCKWYVENETSIGIKFSSDNYSGDYRIIPVVEGDKFLVYNGVVYANSELLNNNDYNPTTIEMRDKETLSKNQEHVSERQKEENRFIGSNWCGLSPDYIKADIVYINLEGYEYCKVAVKNEEYLQRCIYAIKREEDYKGYKEYSITIFTKGFEPLKLYWWQANSGHINVPNTDKKFFQSDYYAHLCTDGMKKSNVETK